jgi:hypothetical protein
VAPIGFFAETLRAIGFEPVDVASIGEHVWHGYDAWIQHPMIRGGQLSTMCPAARGSQPSN